MAVDAEEKVYYTVSMSDTPRTDKNERWVLGVGGDYSVVGSDFARQLERELNARKEELNAAKARSAELEARCKRLEELGTELRECAGYLGYAASNDSRCIARAERAVKAWNKEAKL